MSTTSSHDSSNDAQLLSPRQTSSTADFKSSSAALEVPRAEAGTALEALAASALSLLPEQEILTNSPSPSHSHALSHVQHQQFLPRSRLAHLLPRSISASPQPAGSSSYSPILEDECLRSIYGEDSLDDSFTKRIQLHCRKPEETEAIVEACCGALSSHLMTEHSISLHFQPAMHRLLLSLCQQESIRLSSPSNENENKPDLTALLTARPFLASVAALLAWLPRTVASCVRMEELVGLVEAELLDVLMGIEVVLRSFPQLIPLPMLSMRLKHLQQFLLEEGIWSGQLIYNLISSELPPPAPSSNDPLQLSPLRSPQKALESLTGYSPPGARLSRLELVFRKLLRLAIQRLQMACSRSALDAGICQMAWEWFVELIEAEGVVTSSKIDSNTNSNTSSNIDSITNSNTNSIINSYDLLRNNHLNQVLMAILYTVCRLKGSPRTFHQLSSLLPCSPLSTQPHWYLRVTGQDYYAFYNERFLPRMQQKIAKIVGDGVAGLWAPIPSAPLHQLSTTVSVSVVHEQSPSVGVSSDRYFINENGIKQDSFTFPIESKNDEPSSSPSSSNRMKRIARRLDFESDSEAVEETDSEE